MRSPRFHWFQYKVYTVYSTSEVKFSLAKDILMQLTFLKYSSFNKQMVSQTSILRYDNTESEMNRISSRPP